MTPIRLSLFALLSLSGFSGCVVHTDSADGAVTFTWTVDGIDDPAECRQGDVDAFVVHISGDHGVNDDYDAPCENFGVTIDLPPGYYQADAWLEDSRGRAATTQISTDEFRVYSNDE